jgi:hypothetical protein
VAPRKVSVPSEHGAESQHDRIAALLAEMEREMGPIDLRIMAEVRRAWLADSSRKGRALPGRARL